MGHYSTGLIYKPIDIRGDIAAVFGRNTGDLGRLCSDTDDQGNDLNLFNFWSLRKPIRHSSIGELTAAQWKAANYGYTINSYYGNSGTISFIAAHKAGTTWQYFKPRGASYNEWFRATDFDGYEPSATNPFTVSYSDQPEIGTSTRIDLTFLDELLTWGAFSAYGPTYANLYLGLIAWETATANPQHCYLLPITSSQSGLTILDIAGNERFSYTVSSSVFSNNTNYTLCPVIMTYDAGSSYGTWLYVTASSSPSVSGYFYDILCPAIQVTPKTQVTPDQRVYISVDAENAVYSGDFPMTITSVPFYITNGNSTQLTDCTIYVYFKDYQYTSQGQNRELGHTSAFTINANASGVQKTVSGNLTIMPATYMAQGSYQFTFKVNNTTYTKTGTFSIGEK